MHFRLKILFLLLSFPVMLNGQNSSRSDKMMEKAYTWYKQRNYVKATEQAQKILEEDPSRKDACLLLADIFNETDSLTAEIYYLRKASEMKGSQPLVFYRLGEALFKNGNYGNALDALNKYNAGKPVPSLEVKAKKLRTNCEFAIESMKKPVRFKPENLGENVNTSDDEYWPSLTVDGKTLIFTRLLPVPDRPGMKQEDFYESSCDSSGWEASKPLPGLNSPLNEGAQSVSADGNLLFFTLCNRPDGRGSCDIWFSKFENGKWSEPRNAGDGVNTSGWEGQPSFSAFGDFLYFSSSRPGGKGNKDLWRAHLKGWSPEGNPVWEELTNLGDSINTPGDEISPFIHPNGKDLYFSSDFWPGFGGLDLFHSREKEDKSWTRAENLGYPVNSPGNEQGLIIDRTGMTAYFSTNRSRKGNMDIYRFETDEKFRPEAVTYIRGKVFDMKTGLPVEALVKVTNDTPDRPVRISVKTDEKGIFLVTLPPDRNLSFTVDEKGYLFYSERFIFSGTSSALSPVEREIGLIPVEPGSTINLYNIFFATNEYAILPESEPELNTLLNFLKENPALSVEIGGHTDHVGSAEFNRQLSEKRADSVKQYLLGKGIAPERLSSKGYGMNQPVAPNDTEDGRARNRRTTIIITGE